MTHRRPIALAPLVVKTLLATAVFLPPLLLPPLACAVPLGGMANTLPDTLSGEPGSEVMIEGGLVLPRGDLAADFESTVRGFGARSGYLVGVRYRWFLSDAVAISPSFRYIRYGAFEGLVDGEVSYKISTRSIAYMVDAYYHATGKPRQVRPFIGVGAGVVRNTYTEDDLGTKTRYEASVNALCLRTTVGMRVRELSLSLVMTFNRFHTPRFFFTGDAVDYRWDSIAIVAGYSLPPF